MSDSGYLKCACTHCQGHIEFPAHARGITVTCPHCGIETKLEAGGLVAAPVVGTVPPPADAASGEADRRRTTADAAAGLRSKRTLKVVASVCTCLIVLGLIGLKAWRSFRKIEPVLEIVKEKPKTGESPEKPTKIASPIVTPPTSELVFKGIPPSRKPGEDLQVLSFEVQKARDGNLQYIVGVLTNHAAKQYFNVKVGFDVTRKDGKTGDPASDLVRNLAPNAAITFKANVIGTAPAASAKLTKLEGEKE